MAIFQTTQSADDAKQAGTTVTLTDTIVKIDGSVDAGFRFPNVTVANAAVIQSATLTFESLNNFSGLLGGIDNTTLYGEATDNSAVFSTASSNISGRSTTSHSVANPGPDTSNFSADVTAIVQEIVNRAGWASGNAMSLLFIGTGSAGTHYISPYMWDYFLGNYHANLTINIQGADVSVNVSDSSATSEALSSNLLLLPQVQPGTQQVNGPQVV